jgi:proteasome lid subunit RPN8/RPN11
MVWLEAAQIDQMTEHAARSYPNECLGILVGREQTGGRRILEALPVPNSHLQPERRVSCRREDYLRAERLALELGSEICGFYHSHPDHPAVPSQIDVSEAAFSDWSYLILEVNQSLASPPRSWKLRSDRQAFEEEEIIVIRGGAPCPKF